ncbi:ABC transporter A family member 2-like [Rhododendron vialii]|uniref:ABC transporter A family member 2-like n=1 Tax=Rhododendron vialii TaxID=182163 RepID=UPI00265FF79B|nr:ABC transporter A family member 2-like [Rhododendron vialii]
MLRKKAELPNPLIDDGVMILTLESGLALLIPMGVEHIGIPESESAQNVRDLMVEVYWEQDADGNLCITGHSVEIPILDNVDCTLPSTLLKEGPCLGIVIEMPLTRSLFLRQ